MPDNYRIAILGDMNPDYAPHYTLHAYLTECGKDRGFSAEWIPTGTLATGQVHALQSFHGIIAGSGPYKSKEGVINGIRYARQQNIPFMGTCSGFGYAILEMGQSIKGMETVFHPYERKGLLPEETFLQSLNVCNTGMHPIAFEPVSGTLTERVYGPGKTVREQSHCSYGVHLSMIDLFKNAGLIVAGSDKDGEPKIMEYTPNDFFIITLFLPHWERSAQDPHPLWDTLLDTIKNRSKEE